MPCLELPWNLSAVFWGSPTLDIVCIQLALPRAAGPGLTSQTRIPVPCSGALSERNRTESSMKVWQHQLQAGPCPRHHHHLKELCPSLGSQTIKTKNPEELRFPKSLTLMEREGWSPVPARGGAGNRRHTVLTTWAAPHLGQVCLAAHTLCPLLKSKPVRTLEMDPSCHWIFLLLFPVWPC